MSCGNQKKDAEPGAYVCPGKVAQALLSLKNQFGLNERGFVNVEITRRDLASYSGAAYESLFRTIIDFTEKDLVNITGKILT